MSLMAQNQDQFNHMMNSIANTDKYLYILVVDTHPHQSHMTSLQYTKRTVLHEYEQNYINFRSFFLQTT